MLLLVMEEFQVILRKRRLDGWIGIIQAQIELVFHSNKFRAIKLTNKKLTKKMSVLNFNNSLTFKNDKLKSITKNLLILKLGG